MHENGLDRDHETIHQTEVKLSRDYTPDKETTCIQHSAFMPHGKHKWKVKLKGRRKNRKIWLDIHKICNKPQVNFEHNDAYLNLNSPCDDVEVAAFGFAGEGDCKRMQMALFGKRTSTGKSIRVIVYLLDDTTPSFQTVCKREKANGNQLLAPMSSVLLSAVNIDVTLSLSNVSKGWAHDGENTKTLHFSKVWNSQSSTVPPHCLFVLKQTDTSQQSWACHVTLEHHTETARVEASGTIKEKPKEQHCQNNDNSYNRKLPKRGKVPLTKTQSAGPMIPSRCAPEVSRCSYTGFLWTVFLLVFLGLEAKGSSHFVRNEVIVTLPCVVKRQNRMPRFLKDNEGKRLQRGRNYSFKQMRNQNNLHNRGYSEPQIEGEAQDRITVLS